MGNRHEYCLLATTCTARFRLTDPNQTFAAHADDVDGQRRHRGAAGGDVPRRTPVPASDGRRDGRGSGGGAAVHAAAAVHGPATGGAQRAGERGPGAGLPGPHARGGHHGAVRALHRRQPPAAGAAATAGPGPAARPLLAASFFFSFLLFVCCVADKSGQHYAQGVSYYPPPLGATAKAVQQAAELHHVPGPGGSIMPAGAAPGVLLPESAQGRGPGTVPCAPPFSSSASVFGLQMGALR